MFASVVNFIAQPWPWYVAGPLIGLMVPLLLLVSGKALGISSSLRHMCAACVPGGVKFFQYDWRAERWNLVFAAGVVLGGVLGTTLFASPEPVAIAESTRADLAAIGLPQERGLAPRALFSLSGLGSLLGWLFMVLGGLLVGFGTRYAGGCTSGHAISGLANLQWPSLVATVAFFLGGLLVTHLLYPLVF